jgi:hypothetical protein
MCTVDSRPIQPQSMPNQQRQSSHEKINYGDSSWPLYTMYSKTAEEEDNSIADFRQKSTDGILIFVSLVSLPLSA